MASIRDLCQKWTKPDEEKTAKVNNKLMNLQPANNNCHHNVYCGWFKRKQEDQSHIKVLIGIKNVRRALKIRHLNMGKVN